MNNLVIKRDGRIDSMKGFLIFLVVLGHTIEAGAHGGEPYKALYTAIYSFHMPMFVMISGYVFSVDSTVSKLGRGVLHLIEALVVFQLIRVAIAMIGGENPTFNDLITPKWTLWYLYSLMVWRILTFTVFRIVPHNWLGEILLLCVTLVLALLAGFVPLGPEFVFQRTFTFFPCFIIGVILRQHKKLLDRRLIMGGGFC